MNEYELIDEEEDDDPFLCANCEGSFQRPPLIIFAGEGDAMTATELCDMCFSLLTGTIAVAPWMNRPPGV